MNLSPMGFARSDAIRIKTTSTRRVDMQISMQSVSNAPVTLFFL
jgi:hypothetical protein